MGFLYSIGYSYLSDRLLAQFLALEKILDAPIGELACVLENESGLPEALRGKCCAPLRELSAGQLGGLLQSAAKVRFQNKAAAILARAKQCGWEQALWENLFRAVAPTVRRRPICR